MTFEVATIHRPPDLPPVGALARSVTFAQHRALPATRPSVRAGAATFLPTTGHPLQRGSREGGGLAAFLRWRKARKGAAVASRRRRIVLSPT